MSGIFQDCLTHSHWFPRYTKSIFKQVIFKDVIISDGIKVEHGTGVIKF